MIMSSQTIKSLLLAGGASLGALAMAQVAWAGGAASCVTGSAGNSTLECGVDSNTVTGFSTAIGNIADATQSGSTALGYDANTTGPSSTALGSQSSASASNTIAIGQSSEATVNQAIAIGGSSDAKGVQAVAVGDNA